MTGLLASCLCPLADHMDLVKLLMRSQELVQELGRPGVDAKATVTELQVSQSGVRQVASLQREADNSDAMQPAVPAAVHFLPGRGRYKDQLCPHHLPGTLPSCRLQDSSL